MTKYPSTQLSELVVVTEREAAGIVNAFLHQLRQLRFAPLVFRSVAFALDKSTNPQAVLLDLPYGRDAARSPLLGVRAVWEYTPIILFGAETEVGRVHEHADVQDFITLPIALPLLEARLRFCLLRTHREVPATDVLEMSGVRMRLESRDVTVRDRPITLTFKEFELLRFFLLHPRQVHTRGDLLRHVWETEDYGDTRTVDMHIQRLRAKLGSRVGQLIHTVRNVGYRFG